MRIAGTSRTHVLVLAPCLVVAVLALSGCAENQPQAAAPLVAKPPPVRATHLPGGPVARTLPPRAPYVDPWEVRVSYYAADRMPEMADGVPVGTKTRLVIRDRAGEPVRSSAGLTRGAVLIADAGELARALSAGPADRFQLLGEQSGLVPEGVTFSTRLDDPYAGLDPTSATPVRRYVDVDVSHPAMAAAAVATPAATRPAAASGKRMVQVALTVSDFTSAAPDKRPVVRRETALLETPLGNARQPFAIAVPFAPTDSRASAVVAVVEVTPLGGASPPPDLVTRLERDLKQNAVATTQPAGQFLLAGAGSDVSFITGVLPGLARQDRRRNSLTFLADAVDAPVARDMAMTADDKTLALLSDRVIMQLANPAAPLDRDHVAYALDATSLGLLAELQSARTLPKPLEAVFTIHAGEAARHEGSMDEVLSGTHTRSDLVKSITNENVILLSDSSPASRVRAYDWLSNRGLAPSGYDPLGPPRQRQAALDKWMEQHADATTRGVKNP